MPGLVRLSRLRDSISKYWTTRLASRTSLWAASLAIPTKPGEGESPNSMLLYSPFVRFLSTGDRSMMKAMKNCGVPRGVLLLPLNAALRLAQPSSGNALREEIVPQERGGLDALK